ncbi:hypothetical protein CJU89_0553 [Yarrowia sp. B02]|nr:hypothetical protein CJU89_0553 [Yarrowia sp. B02]
MMAELARKGELLGPRPKADPTKKPRRETIKMAPPTDNGREASLFFHTGSSERERAPTVQVRISLSDTLGQLEEFNKTHPWTLATPASQHKPEPLPKKAVSAQKKPASLLSPYSSIEESGFVALEEEEAEEEIKHTQPTKINNEWLRGIWDRIDGDVPMAEIQNFITDGIKKGYKMTRRHRKGAFLKLYNKEEYRTVVQLCKKLKCDDLHKSEFEAILQSAAETNQWQFADKLMNRHWDLVEKGPPSMSLTALKVFINVDFSIARAFVDQVMHDKRFSGHKLLQEKVACVYLEGARTVALNLSEMMRFATQYQDLPLMESEKVLGQMVRGFHQLGASKQIRVFQQYLCSRGFDKLQGVKEAMLLRYLYLRNFGKAMGLIRMKKYFTYKTTIAGYVALARRHDWEGVLVFHKKLMHYIPDMKIHDTMNCCLIEAYGATESMKRAIKQAKSQKLTPAAVSSLFRVFCHHYPEQSGDLDRLLASPAVSEIRALTKNLDLRAMVPMMMLNSMDVRNGVSIAAFQGVHIQRRRTIEAMVRQGKPERAYKYYTMLSKTDIPFSEHDYLTIIRGLCHQGFLHLAEELLADFDKAIPQGSWRKRVCQLDVDMLRSTTAGMGSTSESQACLPRVILAEYVEKHCTAKGPRRDSSLLGSPKYDTQTGYEWIVVGMHMVSQGLYVEARDFLKDARLKEPMAYALLAECHARLGNVSEIDKLIKEMRTRDVRADQTYKALLGLTEYHYGTGLLAVLEKLKVLISERQKRAVQEQGEFLEVLANAVRMHEEEASNKLQQ